MSMVTWFGWAPVHDPIYGIDHANITPELTDSNWRKKAIVRDGLYIWVVRGYRTDGDKRIYRYYVRIHPEGKHKELEKNFAKRNRALAYANDLGSDEGAYPAERGSSTYITMFPGLGNGPVTIEVPTDQEAIR